MRILGILRPPSKAEHEGARIWAASALAALALLMLMLLIGSPPPEEADLMPAALRASRLDDFATEVAACRSALHGAGFETQPAPDVSEANGCGYTNAVELTRSVHAYSAPVASSCATAAALALWERDVVRPAARRRYGQEIERIELAAPAYQCRRIAGRRDRRLSEHARANAVDISGFTLANGRTVTVEAGWRGAERDRLFLRDVRDGACDYFQAVLSPDYNRAHRDHLHFDLGRDDMCR
ncbi:MAG: extensin family protein [Hyphomonadaceae bacterium]